MSRPYTDRRRMRNVWKSMIRRCYDSKSPDYKYYGLKGITVCDRWRDSLDNFIADIGVIPKGLTIDRIDNSRGYEPGNVRIATVRQQNNNKSDTKHINFNGATRTMKGWAEHVGISPALLRYRLTAGWSVENALTIKPNNGANHGRYRNRSM